ncbi:hypothetical protein LY71_12111 [Geodermatophilus tzadiensis]|uniref:Uncharacterized protein n=1 Tax=Geodermatophilus tzadiensis TaxID=1137988 RepID=A0A2T0T109_9ACTN|nr:hypothetical protein [Geodermatophilus tzadiensis]PRY39342.1 hypothetical protein LY71_12111 [Geodermatophilus tzadiensis]
MSAVVIQNSRQGQPPPPAPRREDGGLYLYSMFFDGFESIAFADKPEELLAVLILGYDEMDDAGRLEHRIRLAIRAQVVVQAYINADLDAEDAEPLTEEERAILHGPRHEQPRVDSWDPQVPLVLVETGYAPYTDIDQPIPGIADVQDPPNLIWLRPIDEYGFLESLHQAGFIALHEAVTT